MRSDSEIKRHVEKELRFTPTIDATDIGVSVRDGVVTLTGFIRSAIEKVEAEKAVKHLAGVVGVANDLDVHLRGTDERADPDIARDAVAALKMRLPLLWERINVVVKRGRVTLEGEVEWNSQREAAESAVRWLKGVTGVTNQLRPRPGVAPDEVRRSVEAAFRRSAEIDANRIQIDTTPRSRE